MLVCSQCGTAVAVAGHGCPSCGHRGSVDSRFYRGEVKVPEGQVAAPEELATHQATASGSLPDAQRAWSPWLAGALGLILGPAGGALLAARNLTRFGRCAGDPWLLAGWVLVGQLLVAVGAGFLARSSAPGGWSLLGAYALVVALVLVRWQWGPVARQRREHPGRHVPGADAFGAFLLAVLLGCGGGYAALQIADRLSDQAMSAVVKQAFPTPPPAPEPQQMMMPPMGG